MVKLATKLLWLGLGLFSIFGFLTSYEPGIHWIWKVIYAALISLSLYGLYPRKPRDADQADQAD
jgi:hypothetical protein